VIVQKPGHLCPPLGVLSFADDLEHDPEKHALGLIRGWQPIFRKDHAQTQNP